MHYVPEAGLEPTVLLLQLELQMCTTGLASLSSHPESLPMHMATTRLERGAPQSSLSHRVKL